MFTRLLTAALALAPVLASADAVTLWTNRSSNPFYGTSHWEDALALPDGGFVVCGTVLDGGSQKGLVRCWGAGGNTRWTYEFPDDTGAHVERPQKLALDPDGTIVMAGTRDAYPRNEIIFARTDAQGNEVDHAVLPQSQQDYRIVTDLVIDDNGNLYTGLLRTINGSDRLAKYSPSFTETWGISGPSVADIELLDNGKIAVCGTLGFDAVFALLSPGGNVLASQVLFTNSIAQTIDVVGTETSECYVTGNNGDLYKLDSAGSLVWSTHTLDSYHARADYDRVHGTVRVAGPRLADGNLEIVSYDGQGNELWRKSHGANIYDDELRLQIDKYGNAIVGATVDNQGGNQNMRAFCYDHRGNLQWENETTGTPDTDESVQAIALDDLCRLCVAGGVMDHADQNHYGFAWRTSQAFHANPDSATVRIGRLTSGNMVSLTADDGDEYIVCKFIVPNQQVRPIIVEFDTDFPIGDANPGTTDLRIHLLERANTAGLAQWIQLWDWQSGAWTASSEYALTRTKQAYDVAFSDVGKYFEPGTTHVRARIAVGKTGPVAVNVFCVAIDQLELRSDTN